jgi:hypothetical protein
MNMMIKCKLTHHLKRFRPSERNISYALFDVLPGFAKCWLQHKRERTRECARGLTVHENRSVLRVEAIALL